MAITAQMVRQLRERSGAGMMECKKALTETAGDLEAAFDYLRKAGLKAADKKAGREMSEGCVQALVEGSAGAMVALTTETDFVVKSDHVQGLVSALCRHVLAQRPASVEECLGQAWSDGGTVDEAIKAVIGKAGENMSLADVAWFENPAGRVGAYVHHNGRVGVLISLTTSADAAKADEFLKHAGMHVAAIKPQVLRREDVDPATVERETAIYRAEVESKPAEIQDKIIRGKLDRFFRDVVLLEQPWVLDDKVSVQKALETELGAGSRIEGFAQFRIGQ